MNLTTSWQQTRYLSGTDYKGGTRFGYDDLYQRKWLLDAYDRFFQTTCAKRLFALGATFHGSEYHNFMNSELLFERECEEEVMEAVNMGILPQYSGLWNAGSRVMQRRDVFDRLAWLDVPLQWLVDGVDILTTPVISMRVPKWMLLRPGQFSIEHRLCYGIKDKDGKWDFSTKSYNREKVRAGRLWMTDALISQWFKEGKRLCAQVGFPVESKKADLLESLLLEFESRAEGCMVCIPERAMMRRFAAAA